jgi:hypothetical protein
MNKNKKQILAEFLLSGSMDNLMFAPKYLATQDGFYDNALYKIKNLSNKTSLEDIQQNIKELKEEHLDWLIQYCLDALTMSIELNRTIVSIQKAKSDWNNEVNTQCIFKDTHKDFDSKQSYNVDNMSVISTPDSSIITDEVSPDTIAIVDIVKKSENIEPVSTIV